MANEVKRSIRFNSAADCGCTTRNNGSSTVNRVLIASESVRIPPLASTITNDKVRS